MDFQCIENKIIDEKLYFGTHKSGLRIYILPKKFSKSYASFATDYGSVDSGFVVPGDTQPTTVPDGIAHFLEHKLFEKLDGGNSFDDYSKTGASANAYTSFNKTAYLFSCTDKFYENLEILLSFVGEPYFTDENVKKEQGIITQEIKMYDDHPDWRVFFNMLDGMYKEHPVKKDIAGTAETILDIDKELLYKCYNTFYNPRNMILFVSGDISDFERIVGLVDKYVTKTPAHSDIKRLYPNEESSVSKPYVEQSLSIATPMFMLGFKDADVGYDGRKLLKKEITTQIILEAVFGKSGDLYTKMYEQGLINDTFGYEYSSERDYAFTSIGGESPEPKKVQQIILDSLKETHFTDTDIKRVRNVLKGRFLHRFNNIESLGSVFVSNIFRNVNILDFVEVCDEISLQDIQVRIADIFKPEYMTLSVINPYDAGQL